MASVYLGVDIGTTSAKCLAVRDDGEVLALAQHAYGLSHPHQDWAEQDPEDYWRGLADVVGQCVNDCAAKGHAKEDIAALALSTQGDTLIATDQEGLPLAPALSWMDKRAEAECHELIGETGKSFWYKETGIGLTALSSAAKIRWLARNAPQVFSRIARFSWVPDFLANRLCGTFVADVPSASWTPLFSPHARDWSEPVLSLLQVSREMVPVAVESGTVIADLRPDPANELGLAPSTRLVAGAFDQAAAAHGAGAAGFRSVLSCGTAWVLYAVSHVPVVDELEQIPVCCHTAPNEWGMVLPFTGGSAYDWLRDTFHRGARRPEGQRQRLVFVPHLYGGLSPDWRGESKGSILGLTMSHSYEDVELALMRGLAFEARRNVEAAERLCGRIPALRMVGGAGKSATWPQIIADALGRPVEVSGLLESAAYGAAKLAAGAASAQWEGSQQARHFAPDPDAAADMQAQYARYLRCYQALLPLYEGEAQTRSQSD